MKKLIPTKEAEKAAKEYAEPKTEYLFLTSNGQHKQVVERVYNEVTEAANAKFSTEYLPVLEKARKALELFKVHEVKDQIPTCLFTGNWDGKKSDYVLGRDKDGQIHVVCCYHGFMDGSEFTNFYGVNDYEVNIVRWMQQPDLWQPHESQSTLSQINELLNG